MASGPRTRARLRELCALYAATYRVECDVALVESAVAKLPAYVRESLGD